ncbi:hypothetical protein BJY01DRAFT_250560 [Aspergillus pseudoustus]|uniref:MYND-type zinc finger protein samB n=1 Tax=Aspergillus pseudoustus TaxID=1810923 RepID=A0ABR4JH62_9EURO
MAKPTLDIMKLTNLESPNVFPSFLELPQSFSLTINRDELREPYYFFCKFIKAVTVRHYRSEIEVEDLAGARIRVALCFPELHDFLLPITLFERSGGTILVVNPKKSSLRGGGEGIVLTEIWTVKLLPEVPSFWNELRLMIVKTHLSGTGRVCSGCDDANGKVRTCRACRMLHFCTPLCRVNIHNSQCHYLKDKDIAALFTGDWKDLAWFRSQSLSIE